MPRPAQQKSHRCYRCDIQFSRREHLQRHERSHTKEKPFACSICDRSFTRKDLLVRHDRLVHTARMPSVTAAQTISMSSAPTQTTPPPASQVRVNYGDDQTGWLRIESVSQQSDGCFISQPILQGSTDVLLDASNSMPVCQTPANLPSHSPTGELHALPGTAPLSSTAFNLDDFESFLDSAALRSYQCASSFHFEQPLPYFSPDPLLIPPDLSHQREQPGVDGGDSPFSRFGSRLPSLRPEDTTSPPSTLPERGVPSLSEVSESLRQRFIQQLAEFSAVIPEGFTLVSRHALSRYLARYVTGFHEHLPFLHLPTFDNQTAALELVLALAAVGAQYCREPIKSVELFRVAKNVALERISRREYSSPTRTNNDSRIHTTNPAYQNLEPNVIVTNGNGAPVSTYTTDYPGLEKPIETVQALLLLMAMATWFHHSPSAREALGLRSVLDTLVRDDGLGFAQVPEDVGWEDWIAYEGSKRTKYVVLSFFNLHTVVFNTPPLIMNSEITMELPCTESEWKAPTAAAWSQSRNPKPQPSFAEAYKALFSGASGDSSSPVLAFSTMGGYVLINAMIQHIWLMQQHSRWHGEGKGLLQPHDINVIECALRSWQSGWEENPESSVQPLSPNGPLSSNSIALLRLAYVRMNMDTGPVRNLISFDPAKVARSIASAPPVERGRRTTKVALHCAHALSIPIKMGINFVAHTQMFFWSTQHALCSLECALLLSKWLESVTVPNPEPPLNEEERKLLGCIVQMVAETEHAASAEFLLQNNSRLSATVVRVWAKLFRSDSIWEMVDVIGLSLLAYADLLEGATES